MRQEGYMSQAKTKAKNHKEHAAAQSAAGELEAAQSIDAEQHRRMIAEKPYFKSKYCSFAPGMEVQD
jgi:hypothetical protein